jgi:hypothetical protein
VWVARDLIFSLLLSVVGCQAMRRGETMRVAGSQEMIKKLKKVIFVLKEKRFELLNRREDERERERERERETEREGETETERVRDRVRRRDKRWREGLFENLPSHSTTDIFYKVESLLWLCCLTFVRDKDSEIYHQRL